MVSDCLELNNSELVDVAIGEQVYDWTKCYRVLLELLAVSIVFIAMPKESYRRFGYRQFGLIHSETAWVGVKLCEQFMVFLLRLFRTVRA
jgi:hypothetical protein